MASSIDQVQRNNMRRQKGRREVSAFGDLIDTPHDFGNISNGAVQFPLTLPANGRLAISCSGHLNANDVTVQVGPDRVFSHTDLVAGDKFDGEWGEVGYSIGITSYKKTGTITLWLKDVFGTYHEIGHGNLTGPVSTLPLIEGFGNISGNVPVGGPLFWSPSSSAVPIVFVDAAYSLTQSPLHAPMGQHSGLLQVSHEGSHPGNGPGFFTGDLQNGVIAPVSPLDLTGYNTILCDFYTTVSTGLVRVAMDASADNWNASFLDTAYGSNDQIGAITLSLDISAVVDKSAMEIMIFCALGGLPATLTTYISNLRASV